VHAITEVASYRRIAHPLIRHPQAPLRSVHAVTEIASYRRSGNTMT